MKLRSSIAFAAMFAVSVLPAISMAQNGSRGNDNKQGWKDDKKDDKRDNGRWDRNDRKDDRKDDRRDDRKDDKRWDNNRRDDNNRRWDDNNRRWDDNNRRWDNDRRDDRRWDNGRWDNNNRWDDRRDDRWDDRRDDHRQQKQNEWRNIAIGAGAISLLGLLQRDNTLAMIGGAGALYSIYRYDQDRKSTNPFERARARYFDYDHFYRDGVRYERRDINRNGQRYYQFIRC